MRELALLIESAELDTGNGMISSACDFDQMFSKSLSNDSTLYKGVFLPFIKINGGLSLISSLSSCALMINCLTLKKSFIQNYQLVFFLVILLSLSLRFESFFD